MRVERYTTAVCRWKGKNKMPGKWWKRAPRVEIGRNKQLAKNGHVSVALDTTPPATGDLEPPTELWLMFNPTIAGKRVAKIGLEKRRVELEKIIEPHVTMNEAANAIIFKGRRLYMKSIVSDEKGRLVWRAMWALQAIYLVEAAWLYGDIDTVARMMYGFAEYDRDVAIAELIGSPVGENPKVWLDGQSRGKAKTGKTKLTDEDDIVVLSSLANNRQKKAWLRETTNELRDRHGRDVDQKTVSRRLKILRKKGKC